VGGGGEIAKILLVSTGKKKKKKKKPCTKDFNIFFKGNEEKKPSASL
jgi:hypothetical protein